MQACTDFFYQNKTPLQFSSQDLNTWQHLTNTTKGMLIIPSLNVHFKNYVPPTVKRKREGPSSKWTRPSALLALPLFTIFSYLQFHGRKEAVRFNELK